MSNSLSFSALLVFVIVFQTDASLPLKDCFENSITFEKILGVVPSSLTPTKLLHQSKNNEPITLECLKKCRENKVCSGFVLYYYDTPVCNYYEGNVDDDGEMSNEIDSNAAWFSKICLKDQKFCNLAWIFERIVGATLVGNDTKTLQKLTREDCQRKCLEEKTFNCKSVKFRRNEINKMNSHLGVCVLSSASRHILPFSYRASNYQEEYIDNLCSKDDKNNFCSYEEYENSVNSHTDAKFSNKTKEECQKVCENESSFTCTGFSLLPLSIKSSVPFQKFDCLIHSEDSKIYGPSSLEYVTGGSYFEKATCLNISVTCSEQLMTVNFIPNLNFKGKLYLQGYPENPECYVIGNGYRIVMLKIPLIAQHCGLTVARSNGTINRTLLSANMVLQYNSLIQTQGDRLIRVGCIFNNGSKVVLGTNFNLTENNNNKGISILNSTTAHSQVFMEVVDLFTQEEVTDVQIGQELQLKITVALPNNTYDIWAGHLVAMTENGADSILLLDDRGCPTNLQIFPQLQKFENDTTKALIANFQAFKFTSSPVVKFSIIVEFCPWKCPQVNCENNSILLNRSKRYLSLLKTINGTTVKNVDRKQFNENDDNNIKMPLDFVMVVRNNKPLNADKLLYGENKVLIAGYNPINNEVCLDYSLAIGLLIVWILLQIIVIICCFLIIRKFKRYYQEEYVRQSIEEIQKNFRYNDGNFDHRRVHWADHRDPYSDDYM